MTVPAHVAAHRGADLHVGGFGDDRGVGLVAALARRQRSHAGGLFFGHRLHQHVALQREPRAPDEIHRLDHGGDAALHVVGAAAVDAAVHDLAAPGIALPVFHEPERHHVVVAVQDEALALARSGQPPHQHRHVAQVAVAHHAEARPIFEFGDVHLPDVEVAEANLAE